MQLTRNPIHKRLLKRYQGLSPRTCKILFGVVPVSVGLVAVVFSALQQPAERPEIALNTEAATIRYADEQYSLPVQLNLQNPAFDRGDLSQADRENARRHMKAHSLLIRDLGSQYDHDLLVTAVVPKLVSEAKKEMDKGPAKPLEGAGALAYKECANGELAQIDCVLLRYLDEAIAAMSEGHSANDYAMYSAGRAKYLGALLALGEYKGRKPDYLPLQTAYSTYRQSIEDLLMLNRMWIGETNPAELSRINAEADPVIDRIDKATGATLANDSKESKNGL
jgi:hypothetical protein